MNIYNDTYSESLKDSKWLQATNPFTLFAQWFEIAKESEPEDPNAMALSTIDSQGAPNVRIVLLKGFDENGFTLFTNSLSVKGQELAATPKAALAFHWKSLRRQVRIAGLVEQVTAQEADAYFATRPRDSQIGAWASLQSQTMNARGDFELRIQEFARQFEGKNVSRPPHWTGYRIIPTRIEFWQDRPFRLHDRLEFMRENETAEWKIRVMFP